MLNASALTEDQLETLDRQGVDLGRVSALHNFYPHPHTGLSEEYLLRQNRLFHRYGIPVGAFAASQAGKRGPLREGLPTLEQDRHRSVSLAARQLAAWGLTESISGMTDRTGRNWRPWPGFPGRCWN